jgi:hypothetical protein
MVWNDIPDAVSNIATRIVPHTSMSFIGLPMESMSPLFFQPRLSLSAPYPETCFNLL